MLKEKEKTKSRKNQDIEVIYLLMGIRDVRLQINQKMFGLY